MAWISFGALSCRGGGTWWQFASRCCWNRARPWHAFELVSFLIGAKDLSAPRYVVDSSWIVMAHGDAREGKWWGNWRMEWVASTLHTTSEHDVSSITTADAHTSAASSRLNWRPRWFKWTRPFCRKTKPGFCACAITFRLASTIGHRDGAGSERELVHSARVISS